MTHWGESLASDAAVLRLLSSDGKEQFISLVGRRELKIGSSHDSDLVLTGPAVADRHCRIFQQGSRLVLVDHGSRDGTQVNDRRCSEPTDLHEGDRIGIGFHLLQVMPGRAHLAPDAIADEMRYEAPPWSGDVDAQFLLLLNQQSAAWHARGRPRGLLLRGERLARATSVAAHESSLHEWLATSAAGQRRRQGARWLLAGLIPGSLLAVLVAAPALDTKHPEPVAPLPPSAPPRLSAEPPTTSVACTAITHHVIPGETLDEVAARYAVDTQQIAADNDLRRDVPLAVNTPLTLCTRRPNSQPHRQVITVKLGDTLESIARRHLLPVDQLRRQNPTLREPLEQGARIDVWTDDLTPPNIPHLARHEAPDGGISTGSPSEGTVANPIRIYETDLFRLRCVTHAYASSHTLQQLESSIARVRNRHNYRGMIMVGDVSRKVGGRYGRHLSHQSGRDVDVWLPIEGGAYRRDGKKCNHCRTTWCRPEPEEVDWDATLTLVQSLAATDAVKYIFLDRELHEPLREAARRSGLAPIDIDRLVQRRSGIPATVTHIKNHRHHIHVRFKCGPDETGCVD